MRSVNSPRTRLRIVRRGAAAVEAALLLPLLLIVAAGVVDIGQLIVVKQNLINASRIGARHACKDSIINANQIDAAVMEYFSDAFPELSPSELIEAASVSAFDENGNQLFGNEIGLINSGERIEVQVELEFSALQWFGIINFWNLQLEPLTSYGRRE